MTLAFLFCEVSILENYLMLLVGLMLIIDRHRAGTLFLLGRLKDLFPP